MRHVLYLLAILLSCSSYAQQGGYIFVKNKNQWDASVNYKASLKNGDLYACKDGLLFDFFDEKKMTKIYQTHHTNEYKNVSKKIKKHAYKISFLNSSKKSIATGSQPSKGTYNYFIGNDSKKWGSNAKGFYHISYENIYDNIDLELYSKYFNLKYDLIVKKGGNPKNIKFRYDGVKEIAIKKERLHIYTSVNHVIEDQPIAYQIIDNKKVNVECKYVLNNNVLSYEFPKGYEKKYDLIIDPTLIFSTFSGSFSNNFGYSATFDSKGFLYSGSSAFGGQYPTTLGAYSTTFGGGTVDVVLTKFDTTGSFLVYSTYLGGAEDELPHSLIVNNFDELFLMGTTSSTDFPTTTNCFDSTFNGGTANNLSNGLGVNYTNGSDIFITHLSNDGSSLLGSTYIGGAGNDGLNSTSSIASDNILRYNYADEIRGEIEIDENNNVYVGTCTRSLDFPTTSNSFQSSFGGGDIDGCVFKFDNTLQNLIYSSYFGGELHDAIYSIAIDDSLNLFVAGGTNSTLLPVSTNAYQTNYQGGRADGFIAQLSKEANQLINSTYYGSNDYDQIYFVDLDRDHNPYVFGQTENTDTIFIENALWNIPGSGQFVSKIYNQLSDRYYSTVFGSGNGIDISPTAFLVDLCNKMYLAGWGGSVNNLGILDNNVGYTQNLPISADAFQNTSSDSSDFYIIVIENDASGFVYGSYFGGNQSSEHVDGGTSRFDRKGKIYQAICAGCGGNSDLPIQPTGGVVSATNNSNCNLGVFKMEFELPYVLADFDPPPLGCEPLTHTFNNTSVFQNTSVFNWDFGDGNSSTLYNPSHTFQQAGTFQVQLIISDTATCNFSDTIVKDVIVLGDTSFYLSDVNVCLGDNQQIGILPNPDTSITYSWSPSNDLSNPNTSNPFADPNQTTTYSLFISNGLCVDTAYQNVIVIEPVLILPNNQILCDHNDIVTLTANSNGTSNEFIWSSTASFNDTLNNSLTDSTIQVSPNQDTWYYISVNNNGCIAQDSIAVLVPIGDLNINGDSIVCWGDSLLFEATTSQNQTLLDFEFSPDSIALTNVMVDSVWFQPFSNQYIVASAFDLISGCVLKDSIFILVDTLPNTNISVTADFTVVAAGNSTTLHVLPNGYQYTWEPSSSLNDAYSQDPVASPVTTTTYTVNVESGYCMKSDSITIEVSELNCSPPDIFLPNAFTPNRDQNNDNLVVRGNYISETNFEFKIFDRLGNMVFSSNNPSQGWDGYYMDKPCDPGVFVYYLQLDCLDGQSYFQKGNITLIK